MASRKAHTRKRHQPKPNQRTDKRPRSRNIGLARVLSKLGYCSRSQAAELVRQGRVTLNGVLRKNPEYPVKVGSDAIQVDGQPLRPAKKLYLLLNKPRGLVTTASDEKGRETIYSCLPADLPWVGPVGRLDQASEGLLLLTNDSEWAARITAPESHVDKVYHVRIKAPVNEELLKRLEAGVRDGDDLLAAKSARTVRGGGERCWVEIVLDEGKNRHIRRMFEQLGIEVLRLVRIAIGPLKLGNLPKGQWRQLTAEERKALGSGHYALGTQPLKAKSRESRAERREPPRA